jgi:hypothetical protein
VTLRAVEGATREGWYTPLLYGCRILLNLMQQFLTVALPLLATVTTSTATLPQVLPPPPVAEPTPKTAILEVAPERPKEKRLICKGCSEHENTTLAFFQERGITDRNALATILGNIKQESTFVPNICEGGNRTNYRNCYGGYGLIQWTSANRYHGLGEFARKYGGSPSDLHTQLRYLTTEVQWQRIEDRMKTPGRSINSYMNNAYSWIGWGIHGARTQYAHQYANRLITVEV